MYKRGLEIPILARRRDRGPSSWARGLENISVDVEGQGNQKDLCGRYEIGTEL